MKYLLILIFLGSCLGQFWGNIKYPKPIKTNNKPGWYSNDGTFIMDTIPKQTFKWDGDSVSIDTFYIFPYSTDTFENQISRPVKYEYPQEVDSAKIYWKRQIYWEGRMNAELERLNRSGHAKDISKALVRYQDSAIHYKILLDRLKK